MKKVLIIYRFLPQYRVEFYNQLKETLKENNIELQLIYGKTNKVDALRNDEVDIDWAHYIPNKYVKLGKFEILWQPCLRYIRKKNLVIVEQANKLIINYILMLLRHFLTFKLGVWGHGRNLQLKKESRRNKFKQFFLQKCDWYFAYTEYVKRYLLENNFPKNKITVVQNAIDTKNLKKYYENIRDGKLNQLKKELGIRDESIIGLYCGAMYPDKRIGDIVEICMRVKREVPEFCMIFIGAGVDSFKAKAAAEKNEWIHYVGPKFGEERVIYFKLSSIQIMPGAVGLGILDSFALQTPLITIEDSFHGPEIEYIENGVNAIITKDDLEEFSQKTIEVLKTGKYAELIEGCKKSTDKYTVENMVENFKNGILDCIEQNIQTKKDRAITFETNQSQVSSMLQP